MARQDQAHPQNAPGGWFVDTRCVRCDAARHWAPGLIGMDDRGRSVMIRQPETADDEAALQRAAAACPTRSIGRPSSPRPPADTFPHEITPGVLALGHNPPSAFGVHSWFVPSAAGNVMTDSPRFTRQLVEPLDQLGGVDHILLGHRDDVVDADKWAEHYGARVWIHEDDADAAPYATDILTGDAEVIEGIEAVHVPGHTLGHIAWHIQNRWLFTGDHLHWNHRRQELDVTPRQTWHSWTELANSMDRLATLEVEWVFAGHGNWHHIGPDLYRQQMASLGSDMRAAGQQAWSERPDTTYDWY